MSAAVTKVESGRYRVTAGSLGFEVRRVRDTMGRRGGHWAWVISTGADEAARGAIQKHWPHFDGVSGNIESKKRAVEIIEYCVALSRRPSKIKCPECLEPCDELVDAEGHQVCPECRDAFEADQAQHDDELQRSLDEG